MTAVIVTAAGERFVGTNDCLTPQTACPREGMASGVGYHLCKSVCNQTGHAEINALALAGEKAKGARLYLRGHTYACEPCKAACVAAGVAEIIIEKEPEMADKPKILELKRKVVFKSGNHLNLRNVTSWDAKGTYVRLRCDEGYVLIREKSVDYHVVTPAPDGITG